MSPPRIILETSAINPFEGPQHIEWVIGLIGSENAASRTSLPASARAQSPKLRTCASQVSIGFGGFMRTRREEPLAF